MKFSLYLIIVGLVVALTACQENEKMLYDTNYNALNFRLPDNQPDSLYVNFMFLPDEQITELMKVNLRLMGIPAEEDRYYQVMAVDTATTAESGKHYEALPERYLFAKGETEIKFELKLKRDPSLQHKTCRLMLALVPSDDFQKGIESKQNFIVNITDNLNEAPPFWKGNYLHYYGGPYHPLKCKKYIEIAGVDSPTWYPEPYAAGDVYVKETRRWFEENPTYDAEGNRLYFENR